ncbi:MAG: Nif3-like dinuclear metal center hexameric protein [Thiomonas sp. 13-66-29]|jgi:dinuclear metal center YbgI/SA1388 family protein|nr:MAG: Nif3-like dinuclear metal center hexameric protein [Thiomonas sp. 13-66-29]
MINREQLAAYLHDFLQTDTFEDYGPNGVQVAGKERIARVVSGVTASLALIERAIDAGADAILVHHGWFWRGEDPRIVGQKRLRLKALLGADINLFAYHLPLDAHPLVGNNVQLAAHMGWRVENTFGKQGLGRLGAAPQATLADLAAALGVRLRREPVLVGDASAPVGRLAWCTGAAQGWIEQAHAAGADTYVSGEISEPTAHYAREMGVAYLACGHHATERYGVQALGEHLARSFGLEHRFIDIDNPA